MKPICMSIRILRRSRAMKTSCVIGKKLRWEFFWNSRTGQWTWLLRLPSHLSPHHSRQSSHHKYQIPRIKRLCRRIKFKVNPCFSHRYSFAWIELKIAYEKSSLESIHSSLKHPKQNAVKTEGNLRSLEASTRFSTSHVTQPSKIVICSLVFAAAELEKPTQMNIQLLLLS
jgi:hypothetical protein